MGQEIDHTRFTQRDFDTFAQRLREETALLACYFDEGRFDDDPPVAGFELEAWLVDREFGPAPINAAFLQRFNNPLVSPELATFNVEFNVDPLALRGDALSRLETELQTSWKAGCAVSQSMGAELAMIGILPTVDNAHLVMGNLSSMNRYVALNAAVLRLRGGRPLQLDIHGKDILRAEHGNVMLEAATTSFQIHLQVPLMLAVRAYNASIIASAPLVAVSANSPYLFGKDLWAETRIPLFEQSVEVGGYEDDAHGPMRRVTFGSGYARNSIMECFTENLEHYPVLLPKVFDSPPEQLEHLRLHNGTLWRWNRPLIGFKNGTPHLRIEQRVVPAGPTIADAMANAAFYYGLTQALCETDVAPENDMPFARARDNFYACAQQGLDAHITWLDGQKQPAQSLILKTLLPMAHGGLISLGINDKDRIHFLGIIEARVQNACNGAIWQRRFCAAHGAEKGNDMAHLLSAYLQCQRSGLPVHEWGNSE
ncbi:MAG: glutamate--cysteine ligase [Gammaproteobacteria bacterium]|nr:glutamate--cysteine ligase [Gammaproteobacteria bacterium]MCF6259046.1 glutamate--cysteine ligase [Gammaproteobacteria bacterium]